MQDFNLLQYASVLEVCPAQQKMVELCTTKRQTMLIPIHLFCLKKYYDFNKRNLTMTYNEILLDQ